MKKTFQAAFITTTVWLVIWYSFVQYIADTRIPTLETPTSLTKLNSCPECQVITCKSMLFGRAGDPVYNTSRNIMEKYKQDFRQAYEEEFGNTPIHCEDFKTRRKYVMNSTEEEDNFPLAFSIIALKDIEQIERLLRSIYRPQNVYCLSIDARSQTLLKELQNLVKCFDNVFIVSKLLNLTYGGFSRLQTDVNCARDLVTRKTKWKYMFNLLDTSFPLKTNLDMVKTLQIYNGSNDMEFQQTTGDAFFESRYKFKHLEVEGRLVRTSERYTSPPHRLTIVKGLRNAVLSRAFVEFVLKDSRAMNFLEWCRYTEMPDEHFWHTLHHTYANPHINAPGGYKGDYDPKLTHAVYVVWRGDGTPCFGKYGNGGFCTFGIEDLPKLTGRDTQRRFFADNIDKEIEPLTLDCMEMWHNFKVDNPIEIDCEYYQSLPFVKQYFRAGSISCRASSYIDLHMLIQ